MKTKTEQKSTKTKWKENTNHIKIRPTKYSITTEREKNFAYLKIFFMRNTSKTVKM